MSKQRDTVPFLKQHEGFKTFMDELYIRLATVNQEIADIEEASSNDAIILLDTEELEREKKDILACLEFFNELLKKKV